MVDKSVGCAEELLRLIPALRHLLEEAFRGSEDHHNLSVAQFMALGSIVHGVEQPGELARRLKISQSATTSMVDLLVERGLVARERRPQDRRAVYLAATPEGVRMVTESKQLALRTLARVLVDLEPERQERLLLALRDLGACLRTSSEVHPEPASPALAS